jgi:Family of unknown function (DUF6173)
MAPTGRDTTPPAQGAAAKPASRASHRRAADKSPAEWAYDRLIVYIRNFEAQLDADHEVAVGFAGGQAGVLQIEGVGYYDPDILTFYGRDEDGQRTQLVQHVSQLSVILRAVARARPEGPPRRIGFALNRQWAGGEAGDASAWPEQDGTN